MQQSKWKFRIRLELFDSYNQRTQCEKKRREGPWKGTECRPRREGAEDVAWWPKGFCHSFFILSLYISTFTEQRRELEPIPCRYMPIHLLSLTRIIIRSSTIWRHLQITEVHTQAVNLQEPRHVIIGLLNVLSIFEMDFETLPSKPRTISVKSIPPTPVAPNTGICKKR